ncbi:unnamed protein product [Urochloa humidicola]
MPNSSSSYNNPVCLIPAHQSSSPQDRDVRLSISAALLGCRHAESGSTCPCLKFSVDSFPAKLIIQEVRRM